MRLKKRLRPQFLPRNYSNNNVKIEKKLLKGLISFLLIILMLFWSVIPSIILELLKIDATTLSTSTIIGISLVNDMLFIIFMLGIYFKTLKKDLFKYFNRNFFNNLGMSVVYWFSGLIVMMYSNYIISFIMDGQLAQNEESVRSMIDSYPLYMAFSIVIYAPIVEELIFRKSIRDIFKNKWTYVLASGLIFGGLHVITSLTSVVSLIYLIPYCSLGIAFACLYYKTDNIFSSIVAHSLHNTLALILYLVTL